MAFSDCQTEADGQQLSVGAFSSRQLGGGSCGRGTYAFAAGGSVDSVRGSEGRKSSCSQLGEGGETHDPELEGSVVKAHTDTKNRSRGWREAGDRTRTPTTTATRSRASPFRARSQSISHEEYVPAVHVLHRRWVRYFRPSTRTVWPAHAAVPPAYSIVPFRPDQRRAAQDKLQIPGPGRGALLGRDAVASKRIGWLLSRTPRQLKPRRAKRPASYAYLELAYGTRRTVTLVAPSSAREMGIARPHLAYYCRGRAGGEPC